MSGCCQIVGVVSGCLGCRGAVNFFRWYWVGCSGSVNYLCWFYLLAVVLGCFKSCKLFFQLFGSVSWRLAFVSDSFRLSYLIFCCFCSFQVVEFVFSSCCRSHRGKGCIPPLGVAGATAVEDICSNSLFFCHLCVTRQSALAPFFVLQIGRLANDLLAARSQWPRRRTR